MQKAAFEGFRFENNPDGCNIKLVKRENVQDNMIDEEKAKAEEAAQEELEQKLERLEGNLGNIRFACFFICPLLYLLRKSGCQFVCYEYG